MFNVLHKSIRVNKRIGVLVYLYFLMSFNTNAQVVVEINDTIHEHMFEYDDISYYEDPTNTLTFKDILSDKYDTLFIDNSNDRFLGNANYPNSYWVRIKIKSKSDSKENWLLEFYDQTIDHLIAFIPNSKGGYDSLATGDRINFNQRTFEHKNMIFDYPQNEGKVKNVYFKVSSEKYNNIIIVLRSYKKFIGYSLVEYMFFGLVFGMVIIISLFNILTFLAVRKVQYVYYSMYIAFVGLYEASQTGIAYHFLWPNSPEWNEVAFGIMLYLVIILALLFTKSFLNLKKEAPVLNKVIKYAIVIRSVWFVFVLIFNRELLEFREIEIIPLSLTFYAGIHLYLKNIVHARYFVWAYGVLFFGFLMKTLVNFELIPFGIITHYSITIAFVCEMLFLSLALGDKIKQIGIQRDKAKLKVIETLKEKEKLSQKVNLELEGKVKERTLELSEANEKLQIQSEQITKFNIQLDLQNRTLQKDVIATTNKRIMKKLVGYDEFSLVFPDRITCYRYLDELKAKRPYCCAKCSNDKYFENVKKFSRRCTKCGYNESVTNNTIFKGIKFPVEKAFYIVYLVVIKEELMTIEKLSEIIDLRPNTCWGFKNKVKNHFKKNKIKNIELNSYENWEFLLD